MIWVAMIEAFVAVRAAPLTTQRVDNGPELIAWALRDWCRIAGTTTSYIEPRLALALHGGG